MAVTRGNASNLVLGTTSASIISWSSNPTAGQKVIIALWTFPGTNLPVSLVDNGTTPRTFTRDVLGNPTPGSSNAVAIYHADNITLPSTGNYAVTALNSTFSGGNVLVGGGRAYSGVATGGPTSLSSASGHTTSVASGNVTPATTGALFFGAFVDDTGSTSEVITPTGSLIQVPGIIETNGSSFNAGAASDFIDAAGPTARGATWTTGDLTNWVAAAAVWDAAPAVASPVVPVQAAGEVAKAADMNSLASAAVFLLNRPITIAPGVTTTLTTNTTVHPNFTTPIVDTDGMWAAGSASFLTVRRYGFYWAEAKVIATCGTNLFAVALKAYAGPNSPYAAPGTDLYAAYRYGYALAAPGFMSVASVIGVPLFPGDYFQVDVVNETQTTAGTCSCQITAKWIGAS